MAENPETARQVAVIVLIFVVIGLSGPAAAQDRSGGESSKSWAEEVRSAVGGQKPAGGAAGGGSKAPGGQSGAPQHGGTEKPSGGEASPTGSAAQGGERR
jgi:hypothetical protein